MTHYYIRLNVPEYSRNSKLGEISGVLKLLRHVYLLNIYKEHIKEV